MQNISPRYIIELRQKIATALFNEYTSSKYQNIKEYLELWITDNDFSIVYLDNRIDARKTLSNIPIEKLFKIAINLDVAIPYLVPAVQEKIEIKVEKLGSNYQLIIDSVTRATKDIYEKPDEAIVHINSALETILKMILSTRQDPKYNNKKHSYYLMQIFIENEFGKIKNMPRELQTITSSLLNIAKSIEDLRSNKTSAQGKDESQSIVNNSNYSILCVNAVSSIILFLTSLELDELNKITDNDNYPF
jgi:hypothetical protein